MVQARIAPIKDLILKLMSDGKPRTLTDVCNALGRRSRSLRASTGSSLKMLTNEGMLRCSSWHKMAVWELNKEKLSNGTS